MSATLLPATGEAQSLRGSPASIRRMYRGARAEGLKFFATPSAVRKAIRGGRLVRLTPTRDIAVSEDVSYPYARPQTKTFVARLAAQYRRACGERLVVTSAVRPATRQPPNSSARSVHPTGIAVDLRKPGGTCLRWLRQTLLELEGTAVIEATEEHDPAHFHVAVFPSRYRRYVAARTREVQLASSRAPVDPTETYRVRPGDTLSEIADEHDTSVRRLMDVNDLTDDDIVAGQKLVIPGAR